MSGRFLITVLLLGAMLFVSNGCSKRQKMIEQQQTEIEHCNDEITEVASDKEWRQERDTVLDSLALEKQPEDLCNTVCKNLQDFLKKKYSNFEHPVAADLLKAVSFDDMSEMFRVFREEPAVVKGAIPNDLKRKVEIDLGVKDFRQILKELDEQYPMFCVADPEKGVLGEMVRFSKVTGVRRTVSGRLNAVSDKGAKFDATFCPFEDMPDVIAIRIFPQVRKTYFRMKATEIQGEQNLQVSKRLQEVLPSRFVECGYLLRPDCVKDTVDLSNPENWASKPDLLKMAYNNAMEKQMLDKSYVFTEVWPEIGKEWVPEDVLDRLDDLKKRKKDLEATLESLEQSN